MRLRCSRHRKETDLTTFLARSKKAVAEGLAMWKTSKLVSARSVRVNYGSQVDRLFDPSNLEHLDRETSVWPDGVERVTGAWSTVVKKVRSFASARVQYLFDVTFFCRRERYTRLRKFGKRDTLDNTTQGSKCYSIVQTSPRRFGSTTGRSLNLCGGRIRTLRREFGSYSAVQC